MTTNPVAEVRQSAKRERVPSRLTAEELGSLLTQLDLMYSVMILLLVPIGMRRGEILALEWGDVEWQQKTLNVRKSIWHQELGPVKTVESEKVLPLDHEMLANLARWRRQTPYARDEGLDLRLVAHAWQATVVAGSCARKPHPARREAGRSRKAHHLARLPPLLFNVADREQERPEDGAATDAAYQSPHHARTLHRSGR
jgi:integrase